MSEGFVLDEGYGHYRVSRWQSGQPKKSIWTGIKQRKADQLQVSTRRCDRCGFLELYALAR
jgi:hypothetical protein